MSLETRTAEGFKELVAPVPFQVQALNLSTLPEPDRAAVLAFARHTAELQRAAFGAARALEEGLTQLRVIKQLSERTPGVPESLREQARALELKLLDLREAFSGDPTRPRRNEPSSEGLLARIDTIVAGHWSTTSAPTASHRKNYEIAGAEFAETLEKLRPLLETELPRLHDALESAGAPWAPGRKLPTRKK